MNLIIMFLFSLIAGSLATMNLWVSNINDVRFHINDVYMILIMSLWMTLFTILYNYKHENYFWLKVLFVVYLIFVVFIFIREQIFVNDQQFLKGMIPHHSMAITMSNHILDRTKNQKIKKLASDIVKSQSEEIVLMNQLLNE